MTIKHCEWMDDPELDCPKEHKINELIDAVNAGSKKLDYIELWIANHEKNILPRFKEEILKCFEDAEFRNSFFNALFPESARKGFIPYEHINANKTINETANHSLDIRKMIISKLDTADLSVNEDFIVLLTMQERMWLREKLIGG